MDLRCRRKACKNQPSVNPAIKLKNIRSELDIDARQNRKAISTTATFCATKTAARLERSSISNSLKEGVRNFV